MDTIGSRLKKAREAAGFSSASNFAQSIGVSYPTYVAHENGSRGIKNDAATKYARKLRISIDWLLTGKEGKLGLSLSSALPPPIPVIGQVAANSWLAVDEEINITDYSEHITAANGYPAEWQYGLIVNGNCLNRVAKHGDRLVCLRLADSGVEIVENDLVIVERTKFSGQMLERTAKRIRRSRMGFELWPESDEPEHQAPLSLESPPEGQTISVVAKVLWIMRQP